jgi:transcriptional regulator with XRE-family HTH domain
MNTSLVGHRIQARRKRANITQAQLAKTLGMSISQISRIEGGKRLPPVSTLLRIATAIGTTPGHLLRDVVP